MRKARQRGSLWKLERVSLSQFSREMQLSAPTLSAPQTPKTVFDTTSPALSVCLLLINSAMQPAGGSNVQPQISSTDIVFECTNCGASLVVDAAAAGATLPCQKCGLPTAVPNLSVESAATKALKISELQRHLKENESQRIEITGYINQLNIQLYRWQLRMETLKERQQKLQSDLVALCGRETVQSPSASESAKTQTA